MTWQGARVLALGYKNLGELQAKDIRELKRGSVECDLTFAGFVIISCPLKATSRNAIKEIQHASHHTVMITGDNPLTACHVAQELKLTRKQTLVLTASGDNSGEEQMWCWQSLDKTTTLPLVPDGGVKKLKQNFDLCVTGEAFPLLQSNGPLSKSLSLLWPVVKVYARVAPKQK
ncbi:manganese-transporting ATPase 13A1-like, partial [Paramuricea clavata]